MPRKITIAVVGIATAIGLAAGISALVTDDGSPARKAAKLANPQPGSGASPAPGENPASSPGGSSASPGSSSASGGPGMVPSFGPNYLLYGIDDYGPDDPNPVNCSMKRGDVCRIRFRGSYKLSSKDNGFIRVGAYENGSSEPLYSSELPVRAGQADWHVTLPYRPSQSAETVRFKATLLGPDRELIVEGQPPARALTIHS